MTQLLRRLDDEIYVQYNMLGLEGTDLPAWSSPTEEIYHFLAAVRLEAWDGEPEPADVSWTPVSSATFVAETGLVAMAQMDGRGHEFLIGPPSFEYGVRMYLREPEPGDGFGTGECEETWLLRFWPIRDVFDPITHAAPFSYIARGVLYYSIDLEPEQLEQPPSRRQVPVPVSAAADWASLRPAPHPISPVTPRPRAGRRFEDPLIDAYYAWLDRPSRPDVGEDELRERADGERIARELCRDGARTFSVPIEGRDAWHVPSGVSRRVWRWEDDMLGGELMDGGLTVDRQVLATNPWTRQILVSGIVTVLRRDHDRGACGDTVRYVVRDAEPHEAARVLCAEATWEEDPDRRRALDEVAKEKLTELRATYRSREG